MVAAGSDHDVPVTSNPGDHTLDPPILSEVADGVATVTLNQPDRKNSLSPELMGELRDRLRQAEADPRVRVIVLTNRGNTFCAGADLKAAAPGQAVGHGETGSATLTEVFEAILDNDKPIIGRIDGHATGGGVGLVAACDLSVMRRDAKIGFTEVRLGVAPAVISVVCLPKMSRADASELFLTGVRFTPDRAAEAGLINRAVDPDDLDRTVDGFVDDLGRGGPNALAAAKRLIRQIPGPDRAADFAWTSELSQTLFVSDEAAAGIAAFRNREPAPWVPTGSDNNAD
jgi:methylglutaconyl-CoA hydratase